MRKFLSLALVMCFVLCGCERSEVFEGPGGVQSPDEHLPVTVEELLEAGYGVDDIQSLTLNMSMYYEEGDYKCEMAGVYEQTEPVLHVYLKEVNQTMDVDTSSLEYDLYYTAENDSYSMLHEWDAELGDMEEYQKGMSGLKDLMATELFENPEIAHVGRTYEITGTTEPGVVTNILKLIAPEYEADDIDIAVKFVYSTVDNTLSSMSWQYDGDNVKWGIEAEVDKVNDTSIVLPVAHSGGGNGPVAPDFDLDAEEPRVGEDEVSMAVEKFGESYITSSDFSTAIGEDFEGIHEGVLFTWRWYINSYSKEGFIRMLSTDMAEIEEEKGAAVCVCWMFDIPYEVLYENSFMSQDEVTAYRAELLPD